MGYLYLAIAVVSKVVATTALKASDGFTQPVPSLIVVIGYSVAFYFLALVLKSMPIGLAYAIWASAGIALIALIGAVIYREIPDWPALLGMALIVAGVVLITGFSRTPGA